ncbi:SusC/RagA family TonB-linked outer membrane protein [Chitinophaga sp. LS1]|uniref:SusC/RagA family TonB-linked outer membrane protein n=1 Tax=Chitinophaga sp. LS1 TaxID=3051176 RepID=UPI002AAB7463|nr:SusC/RagA family TonB-linked outer membrane protein [Chitinophaga sp. LS1]WPV63767.1 SusC/RagA family TonB-linked outer membrane protein [Chitinophaga sp. LS1]
MLLLAVFSAASGQRKNEVSLDFKNAPLSKVFKAIKQQTGFAFVSGDVSLSGITVNVKVNNADIDQAMNVCLRGTGLQYEIVGKIIVIRKEAPTNLVDNSPGFPARISGVVVGEKGMALAGATATVKGTKNFTISHANGSFTLPGVNADAIIVITYLGYATQEVAVKNRFDIGTVALSPNVSKLDEINVLAYGQKTSQRFDVGSSVKVTSEIIEKQPVGNILQALEGRVAGLVITQSSGLVGADIKVQIRGQNSLDQNADRDNYTNVIKNVPLYIVDGVPFPAAAINQQASSNNGNGYYNYMTGPNGNGSPLSTLNPNDIESITVLKDASSTAIYGSRGANGVILITTKKGKPGKIGMSVSGGSSITYVPTKLKVLGLSDYLALRKEAFENDGRTITSSSAPDLTLWSQTASTDFKKLLIGSPAKTFNGSASISGGGGGFTFLMSGSYSRQNSVFDDHRSSNSYSTHFNFGYSTPNQKFSTTLSAVVGSLTSNLANTDFYTNAFSLPPNFPLYDEDGKLYSWTNSYPYVTNPLLNLNASYQNKMMTTNAVLGLNYAILPGFDFQTNIGYNKTQSTQSMLNPSTAVAASLLTYFQPSASYASSYSQNLSVEPQLNYHTTISKGSLTALVGGTLQKTVNEQPYYIQATGFASDLYLSNLALASSYVIHNGYNAYNYASFFSSINYLWDGKYVLLANYRRDGSSKFGLNNLYSNFGSVGLAWIFTEEGFLKNRPAWIDFGKLRGTYGVIGSDGIENYAYLSTYGITSSSYYAGSNGVSPVRLANQDYKWETTRKLELGLDLGLFKDRVILTTAFYRNRTNNQLLSYSLATQTGFSSYVANSPALVQNTGFEFTLTTKNIKSAHFTWTTSANLSIAQNKLIAFPNLATSSYAGSYEIGKPISSLYLFHYTGTDANGAPTFTDVNKDGTYTVNPAINGLKGDMLYMGSSAAKMYGGLSNTWKYKAFQLDAFFQFTIGAVDQGLLKYMSAPPGGLNNVPTAVVDKMRELGLSKMFSTYSYSNNFNRLKQSDILLNRLSYGRLTNLALSYSLPQRYARALRMAGLSANLRAQNLAVFTLSGNKYKGVDPETGPVNVPPLKVFNAGLQFSF